MTGEEIKMLSIVLGGFGTIGVIGYRVWVAYILKHKDKLVELRLSPDGSRQLTIKGYSQEDEAKIVKQLRNHVPFSPIEHDGRPAAAKAIES